MSSALAYKPISPIRSEEPVTPYVYPKPMVSSYGPIKSVKSSATQVAASGMESHTGTQFLAELRKVSAKVQPGRKMERDEAIRDVVNTYGEALKSLQD